MKVFQYWDVEDVIRFFKEEANHCPSCSQRIADLYSHIANVLSYINGDTRFRPPTLAVADACQKLQVEACDYDDLVRDGLSTYIAGRIADNDLPSSDIEELRNSSFFDDCVEACSGGGEKIILPLLLGNVDDLNDVLDDDLFPDNNIVLAEYLLVQKYVDMYFEDVLREQLEGEDDDY